MATANPSLTVYMSTAANVQALAAALFGNLSAGGMLQAADTGQTASGSFAAATGANQSLGYQIWRFNDTLQATAPVFVKFELGSGASAGYPSIWITIGTGSDGAGAITGVILSRTQFTGTGVNTAYTCYFSSATNRFGFWLTAGALSAGYALHIGLERSKASTGADSADGIIIKAITASTQYHQYLPFSRNARAAQTYASIPAGGAMGSLAFGTAVGLEPVYPLDTTGTQFPGLNLLAYYSTDLTPLNPISTTIYGVAHTYLPLGASSPSTHQLWSGSAFAMLYE
jgi:hypothetical protein